MMRAVEVADGSLRYCERPVPSLRPGEVLIEVHAAGLNQADLHQTRGAYKLPPEVSDLPGLEVSGLIIALGAGVTEWRIGDRVCALLAGGGYAEYAAVSAGQCLPLPAGLSFAEGAALPEVAFTCWGAIVEQGRLAEGETILIHGGGSGIGTFAIQLSRLLGAQVIATAGSPDKCARCREMGADLAIDYRSEDFVPAVLEATGGRGCNVVLDIVAGDYVARNMQAMAHGGRHVTIGVMGGAHEATISMNLMLARSLTLTASTLRWRSVEEKRRLRDALLQRAWPWVLEGKIRAVVHSIHPLAEAGKGTRWNAAANGRYGSASVSKNTAAALHSR